jgi:RimJ/RimL family protein N-acetyltransferase
VEIPLSRSTLRAWRRGDESSLVRHANNRNVWLNLRDRFPHPYTAADAEAWIGTASAESPVANFAIVLADEAVGGIGLTPGTDIFRHSAEIGYWLGEPFWGRGIATEALRAVTQYAIKTHGLTRIFAVPFASNQASCRVLEKAGYVLEGRLRRSAIKDGLITDQVQYAYVV